MREIMNLELADKKKLIFKFLDIYFEEKDLFYKPEDLEKGVYLIKKELSSFIDVKDKIKFLKKRYSKIYPTSPNEAQLFDSFLNEGEIIKSWEHYFDIVISNNQEFVTHFFERIKPFSNKKNDFFNNDNFMRFYNFYWDIVQNYNSNIYEDIKPVGGLLIQWREFSKISNQITWIKAKIKYLETKGVPTNKINIKDKTLKDFFIDENEYNRIVKKLIALNIIDDNLYVLPQAKEHKIKPTNNRIVAGIGFLCRQKRLLEKINQKDLVVVLSNTFNIDLKENTYSTAKTHFADFYPNDLKSEPNLSILNFI